MQSMSDEKNERWGEISRHLRQWREGDAEASQRLFTLIYDELHALARHQRWRAPGQPPSLSTTALVHEAYMKLMEHSARTLVDRQHFFALAARAMRQIIEMRFFAGLSVEETADAIGGSPRTIKRRWHLPRAFLFERLHGAER